MNDVLEELTSRRREDAALREKSLPFADLMRFVETLPPPRDFIAAIKGKRTGVIAELKKASPSEGMIREDFRPVELAKELEAAGAAAISVLCEPHRFLGGEEYLKAVREAVSLPLLYKDFISTRYQIAAARVAGADAVLLIAAVLDDAKLTGLLKFARTLGLAALVETHDGQEIERAVRAGARMVGVNCRNLRDFTCDTALIGTLMGLIPGGCVKIAESGMVTGEAIRAARAAGADGFLVGTALMRAPSPGEKLKEMTTQG